ncbi:LOW QUALITY PROTEIN: uncharacterized protein [Drosophila tropicalis]|uniref:LOW QUALITY PROTEIN: uncharacterized protein n=1 Tax=Drosophila tropicalis TaxID=46794 RepID=UPI0035ABD260
MAFITLESIYNLKDDYAISIPSMQVELNFRSTFPNEKNEYVLVPLCSFNNLVHECIGQQNIHHIFEYFRQCIQPCNATGLKSSMEVELHKLFAQLMFSEGLNVDFDFIDTNFEEAAVCNSFHRYILTQKMSKTLFNSIAFRNFVLAVDVWHTNTETSKRHKVFQGVLDPAILLYPGVQTMRFAVELEYVEKRNFRSNRQTIVSILSQRSGRSARMPLLPTFAIIKICLLAPLTEVYNELKVFRESFISQNRLLFCDNPFKEPRMMDLADIQCEAYARFDKFMSDCVRYIVEKNVHSVEEKKQHFCCALQNLTNILLKLVGCDFNTRTPTKTNIEFANLCSIAFNVLELRAHNIVEKLEDEGFEYLVVSSSTHTERLIDHMNAIKLLRAVGDDNMAQYLHDKGVVLFTYRDNRDSVRGTTVSNNASFQEIITDLSHLDTFVVQQTAVTAENGSLASQIYFHLIIQELN